MPIVPLFGDSPIHLSQIYIKAPHIGHGKWDLSEPDEKITQQKYYHILSYLEATKSEYIDFCALFGRTINTVRVFCGR